MTTTTTVKAVALSFLTRAEPGVLALKGSWGVGKTYAWDELIRAHRDKLHPKVYAYVSLFGVRSLAELRLAILAKRRATKEIGEKVTVSSLLNQDALEVGKKLLGWIPRKMPGASAPYVGNVSVALESVAETLIDECIVCLDDFERMNSNIAVDEVLGLISELKERKDCKVVLIFNESQLGSKSDQYQRYQEKVVDIALSYEPTTAETAAIAFPKTFHQHELASKCAAQLGLRNIRVLKRAAEMIELITATAPNAHPMLIDQVVKTTILVAWSLHSEGDKVPISALKHWNSYTVALRRMARGSNREMAPDPDEKWVGLLDDYGYTSTDEVDVAIIRVMEQGYVEESGLLESIAAKNEQLREFELRERFTKAWRRFHDSFADDQGELIDELRDSLTAAAHLIEPVNLNATVKLLRELSEDMLADDLIDVYVAAQKRSEVFDIQNSGFAKEITDKRVVERFMEEAGKRKGVSLRDAIYFLAQQSGWNPEHIEALRTATDEQLLAFFKDVHGKALRDLVNGCLRLREADGASSDVGWKVAGVLQQIAGQSRLNEIRMGRFGITPFIGPPAPPAP